MYDDVWQVVRTVRAMLCLTCCVRVIWGPKITWEGPSFFIWTNFWIAEEVYSVLQHTAQLPHTSAYNYGTIQWNKYVRLNYTLNRHITPRHNKLYWNTVLHCITSHHITSRHRTDLDTAQHTRHACIYNIAVQYARKININVPPPSLL